MTDIDVTAADREAAADWMMPENDLDLDENKLMVEFAEQLRGGQDDAHSLVQAFARHRTQATAQQAAEIAELRAEVERLRDSPLEAVWAQARQNHELYSDTGSDEGDIRFFSLGIAGEGGEVLEAAMLVAMRTAKLADKAKKRWRDNPDNDALKAECADVFAYNIMLADKLGMSPTDLIQEVARKQQVFIGKMNAKAALARKGEG